MWARSGHISLALILVVACHHAPDNRAAVLRADLDVMRRAIRNFKLDRGRYPSSLSELKQMHYLRDIPVDPFTGSRNWRVTTEETVSNDDFSKSSTSANTTVVIDVHSAAGKPYSDY